MNTPIVSVIIPVYNTAKYLRQCLDSVLNQTFQNYEVICVDDSSTDGSVNILNEYACKDSRVTIISQNHSNAGAARNRGISVAKGTYIAFLDSDDYLQPDALFKCVNKMELENSDIVIFPAEQYDEISGKISMMPWSCRFDYCPANTPFSAIDMPQYIFNAFQNWPWNKMFRRSFILENKLTFQEIPRTNDMAFVSLALVLSDRISLVSESLITYRVGTGTSLQSTNCQSPLSFWDAFIETKKRLEECDLYSKYEQSLLNAFLSGALYNLHSVRSTYKSYIDIYMKLKKYGEKEFGFLNHHKEYYYDTGAYISYLKIVRCKPKYLTWFMISQLYSIYSRNNNLLVFQCIPYNLKLWFKQIIKW